MRRRAFLELVAVGATLATGGCVGSDGGGRPTTRTPEPTQVTTTGGGDVEIAVAQIVVRDGDPGPQVFYRLRNRGPTDATVAIRTVLHVDGGGTYEATTYADVPAGGEATVEFLLVDYDDLTEAERANVRGGRADFDTYVNGERRPG